MKNKTENRDWIWGKASMVIYYKKNLKKIDNKMVNFKAPACFIIKI